MKVCYWALFIALSVVLGWQSRRSQYFLLSSFSIFTVFIVLYIENNPFTAQIRSLLVYHNIGTECSQGSFQWVHFRISLPTIFSPQLSELVISTILQKKPEWFSHSYVTLGAIPLRNTLPLILLTINCNWSPNFSTSNISRKQISLQSYFIELTEQEVEGYAIFAG